jgi:uncharacterized membrane-anchored protein YitT (DUF2179 family)
MLRIAQTPKYYQLLLLNIALTIALYKELSTLHLLFSLAFITALLAPVAHYFGLIKAQPTLIHEEIEDKVRKLCGSVWSCVGALREAD